ncbi:MAG: hypothetical protein WB586_24090 [Chthoniobacterales bacterium]
MKLTLHNWVTPGIYALLIGALISLQLEIRNLNAELQKVRSGEASATAAAVAKFERDLLAKQRADEKARLAAQAQEDAARRRNIDQGLNRLPMGNFRAPVYWPEPSK